MTAKKLPVLAPGVLDALLDRFNRVRALTDGLCASLSDAEATVQSMPDASPAKWHLAHSTWFFETFVLRDHVSGYKPFDASYAYLFNSYYEAEGERLARASRGLLIRPSLENVYAYRQYVDAHIRDAWGSLPQRARELIELGCHHEEQHQELILMDLQHLTYSSPLQAPLFVRTPTQPVVVPSPLRWVVGREGPAEMGDDAKGFAFDSERPRHTTWLSPHALADRLVTNREWRQFIEDGGYQQSKYWLSDGWAWVRSQQIEAPLYWRRDEEDRWVQRFGLDGWADLVLDAPVTNVSYYEADAYARWAGARLPTEAEWESAAQHHNAQAGVFLDKAGAVHPMPDHGGQGIRQLFGDVWEWTASAFSPYPGFQPATGAVGEYNGKFMSGQFVLKGGSFATPRGHVRASYRNFFYPQQRWQFAGVRLARSQ
ncbi:ergothioneine biosynthesis protein EgtB [Dyella flava]|uniref:Ergothioneine biosynthesis protein EgtB n=1 Tax=Dyella flava TaxID=1920170 RepID=A0ABS2JZX4_9GAMM|nr:ergothioneine biosynthesis protein EgtB [Dyella flava]MBM7124032.1 ergothioneine biosynthesis protein EgtB [Dyella flava]GLQ52355.1 ergothioneine biosynthesis protein EgtB [Dyella flava]